MAHAGDVFLHQSSTLRGELQIPGSPLIHQAPDSRIESLDPPEGGQAVGPHKLMLGPLATLGRLRTGVPESPLPEAPPPARPPRGPGGRIDIDRDSGARHLPPGRYERINLGPGSTLELGSTTSTESQLYEIQGINTTKGARILVAGPVEVRLAHSLSLAGSFGNSQHPEWLSLSISNGGLILNSESCLYGSVLAPNGRVHLHSRSLLRGRVATEHLKLSNRSRILCAAGGANRPPVAVDSSVETQRETPVKFTIQATDPESAPLRYLLVSAPEHGVLAGLQGSELPGEVLTYTPEPGFTGSDSFRFKVSDGIHESEPATVTLGVRQPNRPPEAEDLLFEINQGTVDSPILLAASDPDQDELRLLVLDPPEHGVLSGEPPALAYSHTGDRSPTPYDDSFTYQAIDDAGLRSEPATVRITLTPVNRPPVTEPVALLLLEDSDLLLDLPARDPDGDPLRFSLLLPGAGIPGEPLAATLLHPDGRPLAGTEDLEILPDAPELRVRPHPDSTTPLSFSFVVTDGALRSPPTPVEIGIEAVNDAPVGLPATVSGLEDRSLGIPLEGIDPDGDLLEVQILGEPDHGRLSGAPPDLRYTPDENFHGTDGLSFVVSDGELVSAPAFVRIEIEPVNDAPVARSLRVETPQGTSLAVPLVASDPDGDPLEFSLASPPASGTVTIDGDQALYTPSDDATGIDRFVFEANDGSALDTAEVVIIIDARPSVSILAPGDGASFTADQSITVSIAASDPDDEIAAVVAEVDGAPLRTWDTPRPRLTMPQLEPGEHELVARVVDASGQTGVSAPVRFTVLATNQAPVVSAGSDRTLVAGGPGGNLLSNGGNEQAPDGAAVPGWTREGDAAWGQGNPSSRKRNVLFGNPVDVYPPAAEGSSYFHVVSNLDAELWQDVDLVALRERIAAGSSTMVFEGLARTYQRETHIDPWGLYPTGELDRPAAVVEFWDDPGNELLARHAVDPIPTHDRWRRMLKRMEVPERATRARVRLLAKLVDTDTSDAREKNDAMFDAIALRLTRPGVDLLAGEVFDDGQPDGGSLVTGWKQLEGPPATISDPENLTTPLRLPEPGSYRFELSASDGELSGSDTVTVVLEAGSGNGIPVLDAGTDLEAEYHGDPLPLAASVDDDSPDIDFEWRQISGPGPVSFSDPLEPDSTISVPGPGTYLIEARASDGEWSVSDSLVVRVTTPALRQPLDLAIVIDHSASMWANLGANDPATPIYTARQSARLLLDSLDPGRDRVALRRMNGEFQPLTSDLNLAGDKLVQPKGEPGTFGSYAPSNINSAIAGALDHLIENPREGNADRVIIVFNDGAGPYPDDAAREAREAGVRVIVVSFPNHIDPTDVRNMRLQATTPADFLRATGVDETRHLASSLRRTLALAVNQPPSVNAGDTRWIARVTDTAILQGSYQDDGLPLGSAPAALWEQISGTGTATIENPSSLTPRIRFDREGVYRFRLTVDDGSASSGDEVTIRVAAPCDTPPPPGLTSWWAFDHNLRDLVGPRDLVRYGYWEPPSYIEGVTGLAYPVRDAACILDGGSVGEIGLNAPEGFSIELRFRPHSTKDGMIFALMNPSTGGVTGGLGWTGGSAGTLGGLFLANAPAGSADSSYGDYHFGERTIGTGDWHHVVLSHDRASGETWLHLDGSGTMVSRQAFGPHFPTGHHLTLGGVIPSYAGTPYSPALDPARRFDGDLDDLAFYARPLTQLEARTLFEAAPQGKCPPSLDQPPVVDAGPPVLIEDLASAAELDGFVSDDSGTTNIRWSHLSGPGTTTFSEPGSPATSVRFDAPGIHTLQLEASDAASRSRDTVQVHVALPKTLQAPSGLVAWIPGNHGTEDLLNPRSGIWSGVPSYHPVKVAEGFHFGPDPSTVRFLPASSPPQPSEHGFTIETWLEIPSSPTNTYDASILAFQDPSGSRTQQLELALGSGSYGARPMLRWYGTDVNGRAFALAHMSYIPTPLDRPFHLALVFDPELGERRAYVDGALVQSHPLYGIFHHHFDKEFFVGTVPGESRVFPGSVDELSFYDRALAAVEIQAIVDAGEAGKFPASPVDDPRLDLGPGHVVATGDSLTFAPLIDSAAFTNGPPAFRWSHSSEPDAVAFDDRTLANATATFRQAGRHILRLAVSDGVTELSDQVPIRVLDPFIEAPVIEMPPARTLQLPTRSIDLSATVADDGLPNDTLTRRWVQLSGPASAVLTEIPPFGLRAEFPQPGDYELALEVGDGMHVSTGSVIITVLPPPAPNQAPAVVCGPDQADADAAFLLTATFDDDDKPENRMPTARWTVLSGPGEVFLERQSSTTCPARVTVPGTYRFRLSVSDGELTGADELSVTVPDSAPGLPNLPPEVSLPVSTTAQLPVSEVLLAAAVADDGRTAGALRHDWTLLDGPGLLTLSDPGASATRASFKAAGEYLLRLRVSDEEFTTEAFTTLIVLPPGNRAPLVSLSPSHAIRPYATAALTASATDDGLPSDTLSYRWVQLAGPEPASIADPDASSTDVTFGRGGSYVFELAVSDGEQAIRATQAWEVIGVPDVGIVFPAAGTEVTDRTLLTLQARAVIDGGRIVALSFSEDDQPIGAATRIVGTNDWTLRAPPLGLGKHSLTATAVSADGQISTSEPVTFEVVDFDEQALTLDIDSPGDAETVTGPVEVSGTAYSTRLASWTLAIRPMEPGGRPEPASTVIGSGVSPVVAGSLGTLDPTLLQNGTYRLTLSGTTRAGTAASHSIPIVVEGNMKIGHFTLAFEDLSLPLAGIPVSVTRTYDSRDPRGGDFGPSWSVGLRTIRVRKTGPPGEDWEQRQQVSGILPIYSVHPTRRKRVTVAFPSGRTESFEPVFRALTPVSEEQPNVQKFAEISEGTLEFRPVDGSVGRLEIDGPTDAIWNGPIPGQGTVIDLGFTPAYPTRFRYTEPGGTSYLIDEASGLLEVEEPNGNRLTIGPGGLVHSSGESVLFTRDASGRIVRVTDPAGSDIVYDYDENGRLSSVTNRVGDTSTYHYEDPRFPHHLTSIVDPRGIPAIRTEFDADGRLASQTDAAGRTTEFEHHLDDRHEVVRDRLGHVTVHEYDSRGNVVRTIDPLGGETLRSYDPDGRETSVTTPLGLTTSRSYGPGGTILTETDPLGGTTAYSYDGAHRPVALVDALGQVTAFDYTPHGNLRAVQDPAGTASTFGHDGAGNVTRVIDAKGTTTAYTHDSGGRELTLRVTDKNGALLRSEAHAYDANGNRASTTVHADSGDLTTLYRHDAENRLIQVTHPDGSTSETVYNSIGQPWKQIDTAGRETVLSYDLRGNLVRTEHPDGSVETRAYDAEGRMIATTNAGGATTYTLHDALGRVVATILPDESMPDPVLTESAAIAESLERGELRDNPCLRKTYDADGRLLSTVDPLGNVTSHEHDGAGRRTATLDALGNRFETAYDAAGRRIATIDPSGNETRYAYDPGGRLIRTSYPDGSFTTASYDELGRRTAATDQQGNTTRFEHDPLGRLVAVIDAEGGRTEYDYDSRGLRTVQRDALGRETRYAYDAMGRRIRRTLPLGQSESYAYDALGRLASRTDFNGHVTRHEYDPLNDRLLSTLADPGHPSLVLSHAPARIDYEYDLLGRRTAATVRNASGVELHRDTWAHDVHSRVVVHDSSTGTLYYAWDRAGNLSGVKSATPGGYDLAYDYDDLNRLSDVHHGQQGIDPNARHLATYSYTADGRVAGVGYLNRVTHAYSYSSVGRLTGLAIDRQPSTGSSGTVPTPLQGLAYTLDRAGHRVRVDEAGPDPSGGFGPTRRVDYVYDRLHRLESETISIQSGGSSLRYRYDPVGNRLTRTVSGPGLEGLTDQSHQYDANDRLVHHSHDANGNTLNSPGEDYPLDPGDLPAGAEAGDVYSFTNRLIRRRFGSERVVDLLYNADGDRVSQWVDRGGITVRSHHYLVDRLNLTGYAQVAEELDGAGGLRKVYHTGLDVLAFETFESSVPLRHWLLYDGLGSVRGLADDQGELHETYTYEAWGQLIELRRRNESSGVLETDSHHASATSPLLFTGEQWDPDLGMYFLRARYLNPNTGRFHTMDTYEGTTGDPVSHHKQLYARADPANQIDPSGHLSLSTVVIPTVFLSGKRAREIFEIRLKIGIGFTVVKTLFFQRYFPPLKRGLRDSSNRLSRLGYPAEAALMHIAEREVSELHSQLLLSNLAFFFASQGGIAGIGIMSAGVHGIESAIKTTFANINSITGNFVEFHLDRSKTARTLLKGITTNYAQPEMAIFWLTEVVISTNHGRSTPSLFALDELSRELQKYGHADIKKGIPEWISARLGA